MRAIKLILVVVSACVFFLLLTISGCGRGNRQLATINVPGTEQPVERAVEESFRLEMLGSSSSAPLDIALEENNGQVLVSVVAQEATALEQLFFNLHYNASQYTPLAAQATEEWVSPADSLVLEVMDQPDVFVFGQVPIVDKPIKEVAPQAVLAEVLFAERAFTGGTRSASAVPVHPAALAPLSWDEDTGELSWYYVNTGDYDQNGVVGISDITPLAIYFMNAGQFAFASTESIVDGDDDGVVTISDLSVIASYFGNSVEGYNLYYSEDFEDVPCSYEEPSVLDPIATFPLDSSTGFPLTDRLRFTYLADDPQALGFYWVRPVAEDIEGIRSNLNGGSQSQQPPPGPGDPPDPRYNFVPIAMLRYTYEDDSVPLTMTFDASESYDVDGVVVFYDWDFQGDGLYDAWGSEPTITHVYRQVGSYAPLVRVTDNRGASGVFQSSPFDAPEPANVPPTADIVATSPRGDVPLTTAFLASGSRDIDGYIAKYEWDLDGDSVFEYDSHSDPSVIYKYSNPGTYIVSVRVTDNRGGTAEDSAEIIAIAIYVNQPPIADLQGAPDHGDAPLRVNFDASGSYDPDGIIVAYWWDFEGDDSYDEMTTIPYNDHIYTNAGIFDVELMVEDYYGKSGVDVLSVNINVPDNELPIADLQAAPTDGDYPLTVDFDASGSNDPDGTIVRYDYDFDGDGIWDAYDSGDASSWTYTSAGIFDAKVRVTDDVGAQAADIETIAVTVPENISPIASLQATPTDGLLPLTVDFDATGSYDPDGTIVRYDYDFDNDGIWEAYDSANTVSWTYTGAGSFDATLRVTDDLGAQATDIITITVNVPGNNSPTASVIASPASGITPLEVDLDASSSSDTDGFIVRYDWDFDGDGNFELYDGAVNPTWTYKAAGTFGATVKVTDDDGAQDTDSVTITVNVPGNSAPVASVGALPTTGDMDLDVQFDATGSFDPDDPDGWIVRYDWDFNGDGLYEVYDGGDYPLYTYTVAGIYDAKVKVTDDDGAQDTDMVTITVTVPGNIDPIADVMALPTSGDKPLGVQFDASNSSDSDGTIVRYDWDLDGDGNYELYDGGIAPTYTYTVAGIYDAKVKVTDDDGGQGTDTITITVNVPGNFSPIADLQAIPPSGGTPLDVELDASGSDDPDGFIVEYEWDFDGDGSWDAYGDADTIEHTYNTAGDYDARVKVTDDDGAQDIATTSISVSDVPNQPPTASFTPTPSSGNAPLSVDFDASASSDPDGTIVKYEWDWEGDDVWDSESDDPVVNYTYYTHGDFTAKLRVTDDDGATDTDTATISVNALPVADIYANKTEDDEDSWFYFSAYYSSDPDGTITNYRWDLDGNGTFEENGKTKYYKYAFYDKAGFYDVGVQVTDNDGATDTDTTPITVHGWGIYTPDDTDYVGQHTSLALVNDKLAISYYDGDNDKLMYVRASDYDGSAWGTPVTVDTSGDDVGRFTSLAVVDGYPAISYYNSNTSALMYVRASDADGSAWGTPVTVDTLNDVGMFTSLAVVDGNPAISYYDDDNDNLKYARADTSTGESAVDWTIVAVDSTGSVGQYTSLAVVAGNPAISYRDSTNTALKYARATTSTGESVLDWTQIVTVDSVDNVGLYTSLAVVDGAPAISYYDASDDDLKYARASTATGDDASDWTDYIADSGGNVGLYTSLAVIQYYPAISYYDGTNARLKYVQATNAAGTTWGTPVQVDNDGAVGQYTSLVELDGLFPAISYYDNTNGNLKFARLY